LNILIKSTCLCFLTLSGNMPRVSHGEICGAVVYNQNPTPPPSFQMWMRFSNLAPNKIFNGQKGKSPSKRRGISQKIYIYKLQIDDEFTITGPKRPTPWAVIHVSSFISAFSCHPYMTLWMLRRVTIVLIAMGDGTELPNWLTSCLLFWERERELKKKKTQEWDNYNIFKKNIQASCFKKFFY
jgi:hypothetical protein